MIYTKFHPFLETTEGTVAQDDSTVFTKTVKYQAVDPEMVDADINEARVSDFPEHNEKEQQIDSKQILQASYITILNTF